MAINISNSNIKNIKDDTFSIKVGDNTDTVEKKRVYRKIDDYGEDGLHDKTALLTTVLNFNLQIIRHIILKVSFVVWHMYYILNCLIF